MPEDYPTPDQQPALSPPEATGEAIAALLRHVDEMGAVVEGFGAQFDTMRAKFQTHADQAHALGDAILATATPHPGAPRQSEQAADQQDGQALLEPTPAQLPCPARKGHHSQLIRRQQSLHDLSKEPTTPTNTSCE